MESLEFDLALAKLTDRWPVGTTARDIESTAGKTRVLSRPGDDPIVLLPGGGATGASWFAVAQALPGRGVHAVDIIGDAGASVPAHGKLRGERGVVDWLDGVVSGLGLRQFRLAGHSYGGWLALMYALARPENVRQLCLVAPSQCFTRLSSGYLRRALPVLVRPSPERARALLAWEAGGSHIDPDAEDVYAAATTRRWAGVVSPKRPSAGHLRRLTMPIDLVLASDDRSHSNTTCARNAQSSLRNVRVSTVPTSSHHTIPWLGATEIAAALSSAIAGSGQP